MMLVHKQEADSGNQDHYLLPFPFVHDTKHTSMSVQSVPQEDTGLAGVTG